jgi:hypothetical protein
MKTNLLIILALVLFGLSACEKVIPLDVEYQNPRLVVNTMFIADSTARVNLTASRIIIDNAQIPYVENAVIKLYENGVFKENLMYTENGVYRSDLVLKSGHKYALEVSADGYVDVTCESIIPFGHPILKLDTNTVLDEYGNKYMGVKLKFSLLPNAQNYFMIKAVAEYPQPDYEDDYYMYYPEYIYLETNDVIVDAETYESGIIFSDKLIDTETYTFSARFQRYFYDTVQVKFKLYYLDENMYEYLVSRSEHIDAQGNPLMEPVVVFSNVSSGMGICGAATLSMDSITILPTEYYYY